MKLTDEQIDADIKFYESKDSLSAHDMYILMALKELQEYRKAMAYVGIVNMWYCAPNSTKTETATIIGITKNFDNLYLVCLSDLDTTFLASEKDLYDTREEAEAALEGVQND